MVTILPTGPAGAVRAAAMAVQFKPQDMTTAQLRDACTIVLTRGDTLGLDAARSIARARTLADTIDRGWLT